VRQDSQLNLQHGTKNRIIVKKNLKTKTNLLRRYGPLVIVRGGSADEERESTVGRNFVKQVNFKPGVKSGSNG